MHGSKAVCDGLPFVNRPICTRASFGPSICALLYPLHLFELSKTRPLLSGVSVSLVVAGLVVVDLVFCYCANLLCEHPRSLQQPLTLVAHSESTTAIANPILTPPQRLCSKTSVDYLGTLTQCANEPSRRAQRRCCFSRLPWSAQSMVFTIISNRFTNDTAPTASWMRDQPLRMAHTVLN